MMLVEITMDFVNFLDVFPERLGLVRKLTKRPTEGLFQPYFADFS